MIRTSLRTILVVTATIGSFAAHAQPPNRNYEASTNPHIRRFASVLYGSKWPSPQIFVCWENLSEAQAADGNLVRAAVTRTWEKESVVRFVGWQQCAAVNAGIRVLVADRGAHTKALGRRLDRWKEGVVLNFDFKNWNAGCQTHRSSCIESIAIHEFGHALGFAHEQNRFDAPGECHAKRQGADGDLLLTPYDPHSVMNYCNPVYNNGGVLSELDVQAVRELYGAPTGS